MLTFKSLQINPYQPDAAQTLYAFKMAHWGKTPEEFAAQMRLVYGIDANGRPDA